MQPDPRPMPPTDWTSTADRRIGALAHLGIPLWGPILPLMVWVLYRAHPFRRDHARRAFVFQCAFLVPYVLATALLVFADVAPVALGVLLGLGFALEIPQVLRALGGRRPLRGIPLDLLPG